MKLQIAGIIDDSVVDGPGVRYAIFTQGCSHFCPGCHNPETHDYNGGSSVNIDDLMSDIARFKYIKGVTFSGGEPFDQPEALTEFVVRLKNKGYDVLIFSGYTFEEIAQDPAKMKALRYADTLIDGRFEIAKRTLDLRFRGSSNQRIVDVQQSLAKSQVCLKEP